MIKARRETIKPESLRPLDRFKAASASSGIPVVSRHGELGEVIESSTIGLVAEARSLHGAPPFGSFVTVASEYNVFGIVAGATTRSTEPNRRPVAFGKTEEELRLEQPQIFELLRTEFEVLLVGYLVDGDPVHFLPPQPARIHSFVFRCDDQIVRDFTSTDDYLRCILAAGHFPADQLIPAAMRTAYRCHGSSTSYLVRAGKELARLLRDDYDRLGAILRRVGGEPC